MKSADERWLLDGSAPQRYERYKVPALFRPLAQRLIGFAGIRPGTRVLDVACGTGIVARLAAPLVGAGGRVVGIDLNAGMLAVAQACGPTQGPAIEWRQADAGALPFADCAFDTVLCQQGLQFFPDRARALAEMRRVLAPGGTIALSVWAARNPYLLALSRALRRHVGEQVADRCLSPLALGDRAKLLPLLRDAGLAEAAWHLATISRRLGELRDALRAEIRDLPFADAVYAAGDAARRAMVHSMSVELQPYRTHGGYRIPVDAHILIARPQRA